MHMSGDANNGAELFSTLELDTIGEIMNISMGSAATAASTLLDNKVTITTPIVNVLAVDDFEIQQLEPAVAVQIKYVEGITGSNILMLSQKDVRTLLAQMMQTEIADDFVIDELAESAMCELMNQMMGSSATVLSCFLGRTINISTPTTLPINAIEDFKAEYFPQKYIMTITFTITITDIMESEFVSVMDIDLSREIIEVSLNFDKGDEEEQPPMAPPSAAPAPPPAPTPPPAAPAPSMPAAPQVPVAAPPPPPVAYEQQPYPQQQPYPPPQYYPQQPYPQQQPYPANNYAPPPQHGYGAPAPVPENPIMVKEFDYNDFGAGGGVQEMPANIDLVMNVPVVVTVELGRTKRKIKEILEFGQGTIVELDKQAGSQVDVIVNGQLIARGDVVVVDDNFSIRITEILKSRDSLTML